MLIIFGIVIFLLILFLSIVFIASHSYMIGVGAITLILCAPIVVINAFWEVPLLTAIFTVLGVYSVIGIILASLRRH
jgi:hypothetical protein